MNFGTSTALGIDIGGSSVKVALLDAGRLITTGQSERYRHPDAHQLRAAISQALDGFDRANTVSAVGLCLPGLFDQAARHVTRSVNVPGLVDVNIDDLLRPLLAADSRPVVVSDALAAATDAAIELNLTGRVLAISIGTGIGAGVLDDGRPLVFTGSGAGHIGQLDVTVHEPDRAPPIAPDGGRGGLEGYLGLPALAERYGPDVEAFLSSRARGDEAPFIALARAIRIAHAIYRMDHCVLLGGTGIRLRRVLPILRGLVDDHLTVLARPASTLICGTSDHHAAKGAARLAMR